MIIERVNNEIIIRLPGDINIDELQDMTDWFRYMEITRKSKAKQTDVDTLVNKIKKRTVEQKNEIEEHKDKLKRLAGYYIKGTSCTKGK